MIENKIEVYGGFVATFDEERYTYKFFVPWLSRNIEVWLSSGDLEDEKEMDHLKKTFERFWVDKDKYLKMGQDDIKSKLIPYISTHKSDIPHLNYPKVSPDDFDAEYWLTSVYISAMTDSYTDVQLNFNKEDDELNLDELSVRRDINTGYLEFYAAFNPITID